MSRYDAAVVGAGTAGLNAAAQLARRGLSCVLIERRAIGTGGARWRNGVLSWQFARAGVPQPVPFEDCPGARTLLLDPDGLLNPEAASVVAVDEPPVVDADMRALNDTLVAAADAAGVDFVDGVCSVQPVVADGRLRAVAVSGEGQAPTVLAADLVVDASGRDSQVAVASQLLSRWLRPATPLELCSAAQYTCAVNDVSGAEAFLSRHSARPGDTVTVLGADGGFSALSIGVSPDLGSVSVLTGTVAGGPWGTGRDVFNRFLAAAPWVGGVEFGGEGLIPLRRPQDRFSAAGLALVGDAACQVFPAHGSGIGIGLIAGTVLAEQVAGFEDPGSEPATWAYQDAFQRQFGGTLAAFDVMRRFSSAIGSRGVRNLFRSKMFTPAVARGGLEQRWSVPPIAESVASLKTMATNPGVGAPMAAALARAAAVRALHARHPTEPDEQSLRRWSTASARLVGPARTR